MPRRFTMLVLLLVGATLTGCYAETLPATNVTATSAVLHARGHTDSTPAEVYFEYATTQGALGTSASFTTPRRSVPANVPGQGQPDVPFNETVKALQPSTTYWFRVCGRDGGTNGDICNQPRSFATPAGTPEVSFGPATPYTVPAARNGNHFGVASADFNRDGKLDLAIATSDGVLIRRGDGNGGFGAATSVSSADTTFAQGGDVNRDGKPDLVTGELRSGVGMVVVVRLGNGAGGFGAVFSEAGSFGETFVHPLLRDLDRDGDLDLLVLNTTAAHFALPWVGVLEGDGAGHFEFRPDLLFSGGAAFDAGDVNRDGIPDVVMIVAHQAGEPPEPQPSTLDTALGNGGLSFRQLPGPKAGSPIVLGDFDRDGRADAVTFDAVWRGNGDGTFGRPLTFTPGSSDLFLRADFNRDGIPDAARDGVQVLLGNGDGTLATPNSFDQRGVAVLLSGDFNRDGKPDILARRFVCCTAGPWQSELRVLLNTTP